MTLLNRSDLPELVGYHSITDQDITGLLGRKPDLNRVYLGLAQSGGRFWLEVLPAGRRPRGYPAYHRPPNEEEEVFYVPLSGQPTTFILSDPDDFFKLWTILP